MYSFVGNSFQEIYVRLLETLESEGEIIAKSKTIPFVNIHLKDPSNNLLNIRKNWIWALHEGINRLSFHNPYMMNPGTAYLFRPNWGKKLEKEGGFFHYSYGELYSPQIQALLKVLKAKSEREGILTVWDSKYLINRSAFLRRPCTLNLHFFRVKDELNCVANMRTVDVMNLLPYDIFHHTMLQRIIATELDLDLGEFSLNASFAYYQKKRDVTGSVINTIKKLKNAASLEYTEDWRMDFGDINRISRCLHDLYVLNDHHGTNYLTALGDYARNYANALLTKYYAEKLKNPPVINLKEFEVIRL